MIVDFLISKDGGATWSADMSLAGGPCACKGMTAVVAHPASPMEPRSITPRRDGGRIIFASRAQVTYSSRYMEISSKKYDTASGPMSRPSSPR